MHTPGTGRKSTFKLREKHGHIANTKKCSIHAKQIFLAPSLLFSNGLFLRVPCKKHFQSVTFSLYTIKICYTSYF